MSQIIYCDVCEEQIERRSDHWRVCLKGDVHPHNNDFLPPRAADVCTGCLRVWVVGAGPAVVVLDADFVRARRIKSARETITPSTTA